MSALISQLMSKLIYQSAEAKLGVHALQQPSERWDGGHSNSAEACFAAITESGPLSSCTYWSFTMRPGP